MTARFVDVHVLQSVPFNNLNRDDLGSPKSVVYGGVPRTRVSSQCWKRATREHMQDHLADVPGYDVTMRTRRSVAHLADVLTARGWAAEDGIAAARVIFAAFLKEAKDEAKANAEDDGPVKASKSGAQTDEDTGSVLLFLTQSQYDDLADLVVANKDEVLAAAEAYGNPKAKASKTTIEAFTRKGTGKRADQIIASPRGLVTVFGRMLASLPSGSVDAGVQVAHAFTTHESSVEYDYFSAVDDLNKDGDQGAGHIGTGEFSSGVYYRYATVDLQDLARNTGSDADSAILTQQFLRSFIESLPSGKANVTAPHTVPGLVVISVREDKPVSFAAAYESPVRAGGVGHMVPSLSRLAEHAALIAKVYGDTAVWTGHVNAATADQAVTGQLAGAFGQEVHGGLSALIETAVAQCGLNVPTQFTGRAVEVEVDSEGDVA